MRAGDIVEALGFRGCWLRVLLDSRDAGNIQERKEAWVLHLHKELGFRVLAPLLQTDGQQGPRELTGDNNRVSEARGESPKGAPRHKRGVKGGLETIQSQMSWAEEDGDAQRGGGRKMYLEEDMSFVVGGEKGAGADESFGYGHGNGHRAGEGGDRDGGGQWRHRDFEARGRRRWNAEEERREREAEAEREKERRVELEYQKRRSIALTDAVRRQKAQGGGGAGWGPSDVSISNISRISRASRHSAGSDFLDERGAYGRETPSLLQSGFSRGVLVDHRDLEMVREQVCDKNGHVLMSQPWHVTALI